MITFDENIDDPQKEDVVDILPLWKTHILEMCRHETLPEFLKEIKLLVAVKTKEEFKKWQLEFEGITKTTYSVRSTDKIAGKKVLFKQRLVCHHNTECERIFDPAARNNTKNTNCPSKMIVSIHTVQCKYRGKHKDKVSLFPIMPCEITLTVIHNHDIGSADTLKFRRPSPEVKEELLNLFHQGHSPHTAHETMKMQIQLKYSSDETALVDRMCCPDYNYCYRLYQNEFKKKYGPMVFHNEGKELLNNSLKEYNSLMGELCAKMVVNGSSYVICICSPLAKRIHKFIPAASQMVFMGSTGSLDHDGSKLYALLTYSECGELPLGVIISSSGSADSIKMGFTLLKEIVGATIFGGSVGGPEVFLTGDSEAEQMAIHSIWSKSKIFLCVSYVLQSFWKWLTKGKNGIPQEKQCEYFQDFKSIMFAQTEEECLNRYIEARHNISDDYYHYADYLVLYWEKREIWALAYRNDLVLQESNSCNFSEDAMKILKDKIFGRTKAFNLVQMVDFVLTKFNLYFERGLLDAASNQVRKNPFERTIKPPPAEILSKIEIINDNIFLIPSETEKIAFYLVNLDVLMCSCIYGNIGKMCKHIDWARSMVNSQNNPSPVAPGYDISLRRLYYIIASNEEPPDGCLESPQDDSEQEQTDLFSEEIGLLAKDDIDAASIVKEDCYEVVVDVESTVMEQPPTASTRRGEKLLGKIQELCRNFLHQSPEEVTASLEIMCKRMRQIKTPADFSSHCSNYGEPPKKVIIIQPAAVTQNSLSGPNSLLGGKRLITLQRVGDLPTKVISLESANTVNLTRTS